MPQAEQDPGLPGGGRFDSPVSGHQRAEHDPDLQPGGRVERMAHALAMADRDYYPADAVQAAAMWAEHWRWYLNGRGKGGSADISNHARWERMARAALAQIDARATATEQRLRILTVARPLAEYQSELGDVLWWQFPVNQRPYVGSPLDSRWPRRHTHWTMLPTPRLAESG